MKILVGHTGFVGSNLLAENNFDGAYHSVDVHMAYRSRPDLLVYAGLPAAKFLANKNSAADMKQIYGAEENIEKINPKKLVLISTVDVFADPVQVDENTEINTEGLSAYGLNRYRLECWVREHYPDALIVRLPGLFGRNLKKNFIYDMLHPIPSMLSGDRFKEFSAHEKLLEKYYILQENGFYKSCFDENNLAVRQELLSVFERLKFSALMFTDSRSTYQFYPLSRLWKDINIALEHDIELLHLATEPVGAGELYNSLMSEEFINEIMVKPVHYDYRTVYSSVLGGNDFGYIMDKEMVISAIKDFISES